MQRENEEFIKKKMKMDEVKTIKNIIEGFGKYI